MEVKNSLVIIFLIANEMRKGRYCTL